MEAYLVSSAYTNQTKNWRRDFLLLMVQFMVGSFSFGTVEKQYCGECGVANLFICLVAVRKQGGERDVPPVTSH